MNLQKTVKTFLLFIKKEIPAIISHARTSFPSYHAVRGSALLRSARMVHEVNKGIENVEDRLLLKKTFFSPLFSFDFFF